MIRIEVTSEDLSLLKEDLSESVVTAVSRLAAKACFEIRSDLSNKFTLRNNYVVRGIRYSRATRSRPFAEVYSKDEFMLKQEEGGSFVKTAHRFSIPRAVRKSERSLIRRTKRPKYLLENDRIFKSDPYDPRAPHRGFSAIYSRSKDNKSLRVEYLLTGKRRYRPRWGFFERVEATVNEQLDDYL